jgi:hypothetical protein
MITNVSLIRMVILSLRDTAKHFLSFLLWRSDCSVCLAHPAKTASNAFVNKNTKDQESGYDGKKNRHKHQQHEQFPHDIEP